MVGADPALALALAAATGLLAIRFPRRALVGLLLWLLLEGELRRRVPALDTTLLLAKDVWIAALYVALLLHAFKSRRRLIPRVMKPPMLVWLVPLLLISVMQVFGTHSPGITTGILGVKIYFFYIPLAFVVAWWTTSARDVKRLLRVFAVMATVGGLGAIYYLAVDPQIFSQQVTGAWTVRPRSFGDETLLLPTSVYMGEGRLGGYSMFFTLLFAGVLLTSRRVSTSADYRLYTVAFVFALLGLIVSGRRTPILTALGLLPLLAVVVRRPGTGIRRGRRQKSFARLALAGAIGAIILMAALPEHSRQLVRFGESTFETDPDTGASSSFRRDAWNRPIEQFGVTVREGGWWGRGIGVSSQGQGFIGSSADEQNHSPSEHGPHKVLWELGVVGLIAFAGFYLAMWRATYKTAARTRGTPWNGVATGLSFAVASFLLHVWKSYQFHDDAFQQIMVWTFVGMLFAVAKLSAVDQQVLVEPGSVPAHPTTPIIPARPDDRAVRTR